ncbi:MAG: glycosyltransferase family 2 protein [Pirellulaceae bacterium]
MQKLVASPLPKKLIQDNSDCLAAQVIKISLLTPSYNHADFIQRTIDSVLQQQGDFELDYVVLDGGSTDATTRILKGYGESLRWTSKADGGQIEALNHGLDAATGDVVGWLNSDDMLLPGALQKVAEGFAQNPQAVWLHGDCTIVDRDDKEIRQWVSAYKRYRARRYSRKKLLSSNFISQMTVFWKRTVMHKIGMLDSSLTLAFDYDYWLRLSKIADPIYVPSPLAAFRWYPTSKSGGNLRRQCQEDERVARGHGLHGVGLWTKRFENWLRVTYLNK